MTQLLLFDPALDELVAAGVVRHGPDLADHQRGQIVLGWDTADGRRKGDLIPAWVCCVCGQPEPNAYWLAINHACADIPGCAGRNRDRVNPWKFRLAGEAE